MAIVNGGAVSGAGLGAGVAAPCAVRRATFPRVRGVVPVGGRGLFAGGFPPASPPPAPQGAPVSSPPGLSVARRPPKAGPWLASALALPPWP